MKLSNILLLLLLIGSTTLFAQKSKAGKTPEKQSTSAIIPSDWYGTYFGITNCANCDGIETRLVLQKDNTYTLSTKPTNTTEAAFIQKGSFKRQGDIIVLEGITVPEMADRYKVEKNQVKQLYMIDHQLQGENWTGYILKKTKPRS